jgi:hypothetical protein
MTHYQQREGEQWGSWRIQVSPAAPVRQAEFLSLLYAATTADDTPPEAEILDSDTGRPAIQIRHGDRTFQLLYDSGETPGGDIRILDSTGSVLLEKRLSAVVQPQSAIGN